MQTFFFLFVCSSHWIWKYVEGWSFCFPLSDFICHFSSDCVKALLVYYNWGMHLMRISKKKKSTVCFLQTSKQFQFRHHFISIFHLELIFISLILQSLFLDIAHSMVFWSQIYSLPCPDSRVLWSLNKRFSGFREGWRFWVVQISFCSPFGSDTEMRLNLWCQCAFTLKILRCKGHEQETTISDT